MKKIFALLLIGGVMIIFSPSTISAKQYSENSVSDCGPKGVELKRGPKGGCYYINKNGNKTYVDRSCCK
jgi:hypothetical protein